MANVVRRSRKEKKTTTVLAYSPKRLKSNNKNRNRKHKTFLKKTDN